MNIGIILAAGKGTRLNCTTQNKTTLAVGGKPMVKYGVELFEKTMDKTVVVVGAFAESVKESLAEFPVLYAVQEEQKGTGHAVKIALDIINIHNLSPKLVVVGYGDHMMYYHEDMVKSLLDAHTSDGTALSLVTTTHEDPISLAWGRIIKDADGFVEKIVEQKEANEEELKVNELNAGFYCFNYQFLESALKELKPSPFTHEYYLTDLISIANKRSLRVVPIMVPFSNVGSGINTIEQLQQTDADFVY